MFNFLAYPWLFHSILYKASFHRSGGPNAFIAYLPFHCKIRILVFSIFWSVCLYYGSNKLDRSQNIDIEFKRSFRLIAVLLDKNCNWNAGQYMLGLTINFLSDNHLLSTFVNMQNISVFSDNISYVWQTDKLS